MRSRPTEQYIVLGAQLWYLMEAVVGWGIHEPNGFVHTTLSGFRASLSPLGFHVTARLAEQLAPLEEQLASEDEDARLTAEQHKELRSVIPHVHRTLYAEAAGNIAFIATDKRYDVKRLIGDIGSFFPRGAYDQLPPIARRDLAEAGICIAFERPTAAAFHALRATESALRHFYACVVKRNRLPEPWLWAPIVDAMKARRKPPDAVLLENLDALRRNFRNPTQHPEKEYTVDEAQDLLAACIDVLSRMVGSPEWQPSTLSD